jgi:hypothetical protein
MKGKWLNLHHSSFEEPVSKSGLSSPMITPFGFLFGPPETYRKAVKNDSGDETPSGSSRSALQLLRMASILHLLHSSIHLCTNEIQTTHFLEVDLIGAHVQPPNPATCPQPKPEGPDDGALMLRSTFPLSYLVLPLGTPTWYSSIMTASSTLNSQSVSN